MEKISLPNSEQGVKSKEGRAVSSQERAAPNHTATKGVGISLRRLIQTSCFPIACTFNLNYDHRNGPESGFEIIPLFIFSDDLVKFPPAKFITQTSYFMNRGYWAIALLTFFVAGCSSGKKAYERGDYYGAVMKSINRLRQNPDHSKSIEALRNAYPMAVEYYENEDQNEIASK